MLETRVDDAALAIACSGSGPREYCLSFIVQIREKKNCAMIVRRVPSAPRQLLEAALQLARSKFGSVFAGGRGAADEGQQEQLRRLVEDARDRYQIDRQRGVVDQYERIERALEAGAEKRGAGRRGESSWSSGCS